MIIIKPHNLIQSCLALIPSPIILHSLQAARVHLCHLEMLYYQDYGLRTPQTKPVLTQIHSLQILPNNSIHKKLLQLPLSILHVALATLILLLVIVQPLVHQEQTRTYQTTKLVKMLVPLTITSR